MTAAPPEFGPPTSFRLPLELHAQVESEAAEAGLSIHEYVRRRFVAIYQGATDD